MMTKSVTDAVWSWIGASWGAYKEVAHGTRTQAVAAVSVHNKTAATGYS